MSWKTLTFAGSAVILVLLRWITTSRRRSDQTFELSWITYDLPTVEKAVQRAEGSATWHEAIALKANGSHVEAGD